MKHFAHGSFVFCLIVFSAGQICPYSSGLLNWYWGDHGYPIASATTLRTRYEDKLWIRKCPCFDWMKLSTGMVDDTDRWWPVDYFTRVYIHCGVHKWNLLLKCNLKIVEPEKSINTLVRTQHCGYGYPNAKAPSRQHPECLENIHHCIELISGWDVPVIVNNIKRWNHVLNKIDVERRVSPGRLKHPNSQYDQPLRQPIASPFLRHVCGVHEAIQISYLYPLRCQLSKSKILC